MRLIFHLFKSPSNDKEIVALQEIMNEFKNVDIECSFVKSSLYTIIDCLKTKELGLLGLANVYI